MMVDIHNTNSLKVADIVPDGAVNLSYYSIRKPSIPENINIANMLEPVETEYITFSKPGQIIESRFFLVTDKFVTSNNDIKPLYYKYVLKYQMYNASNNIDITIVTDHGYMPDKYKILKEVEKVGNNLYTVTLYTNFWMDSTIRIYAIYNPMINGKLKLDHKELINPYPYMRRKDEGTLALDEYKLIEKNKDNNQYTIQTPTTNIYYILPLDGKSIMSKDPIDINGNWYTRIVNGYTSKYMPNTHIPERVSYTICDYYDQEFSDLGLPYMRITESPTIVGKNTVRLKNKPVYAPLDVDGNITQISATVNGNHVIITSVDTTAGIVQLNTVLNPNDIVEVTYVYMEDAFIYKGYTINMNGEDIMVPLDLNPAVGHEYGYLDSNGVLKVEASFKLLNKTICIYAKPTTVTMMPISTNDEVIEIPESTTKRYIDVKLRNTILSGTTNIKVIAKYSEMYIPYKTENSNIEQCTWSHIEGSSDTLRFYNTNYLAGEPLVVTYMSIGSEEEATATVRYNKNVLFHTIDELDKQEEDRLRAILIAKIYVRPNSSRDMVKIIDTRTRGGGIVNISDDIRMKINPETQYYLDIGNIDGEPIQENAVVIVKMNKYLLKQHGGDYTEQDIQNAIDKFKAFGVLAVIEYVEPDTHSQVL